MAGVGRQWIRQACLWLSIATVFAHAVLPVGSPLARASGSAFSASTLEVALGPSRRDGPAQLRKQLSLEADESDSAADAPFDPPSGLLPSAAQSLAQPHLAIAVLAAPATTGLGHIPVGYRSRGPPRA